MKTLKELQELLQKHLKDARDLCDLVEKEKRDFTSEERGKVATYLAEAKKAKDELKTLQGDEEMRKSILELGAGIELNEGGNRGSEAPGAKGQTMGERFVNAKAWQDWLKQVAPGGHIQDSRKGLSSPSVDVKDFGLFRQKTTLTGASATSAGAFVESDRTGIYEPLGRYPLTLRDLISIRNTTSDMIEFVRQTAQVTQAATVQESNVTNISGATGEITGQKPEAAMTFERVTEHVKTIAVWIPATKRALSDAAQLRGLIDQELREDLGEEFEWQLINGDGIGENFTGLANTANILVQPFVTDLITTARRAITNLLLNGRQTPTAWLLHPTDWEAIDLLQDLTGRYYWGGPQAPGPRTLWGVPVVQNFFLAQGTAYLGNWRKMVVWDREQSTISVSDSHSDFFIRNMVAILAEMRAAMGVIRPTAFVEVDLAAGS